MIAGARECEMPPLGVLDQDRGIEDRREMSSEGLRSAAARGDARQRLGECEQCIRPVAANPPGMNNALLVHYGLAFLVAAAAVLLIWWPWGRRVMLYLLTVHILVGGWVLSTHLRAPTLHYLFAVLGWFGYMAANGIGRRPGKQNMALAITIGSSVAVLVAFAIGYGALKASL